jgi:ElaA protein
MPSDHLDELHAARFDDLDSRTLYAILKLRSDIFVVEQNCVYGDLDGRDDEPGTWHLYLERDGEVSAYLRILTEEDGLRVGRVVTAKHARGAGLAGRLIAEAMRLIGDRRSLLNAQAHLAGYYARFGYRPDGPEFLEDGIPHVPMIREGSRSAR